MSSIMTIPTKKAKSTMDFRKGDEVATVAGGGILFGTLEYPDKANPGEWIVHWNEDIWSPTVPKKCSEGDMVVTDRALYPGCKVRRADQSTNLTGVCRSVTLSTDLRIVGTMTVLPSVNSADLTHLKEFKQKSVVYERGWLGVITEVERDAKIRFPSGDVQTVSLNSILKTSRFTVESPWINEGVNCSLANLTALSAPKGNQMGDASDASDPNNADELPKPNLNHGHGTQRVYIEDIEVISVKVAWRFQLDLFNPNAPPSVYKGPRLKSLSVVKEDFSSESTFHVGNLCRYKIRTDNEFISMAVFEKKLILEHFPSRVDDLKPVSVSKRAYDQDPESRLTPEKFCVVELVHLTGTGDIFWQNGEMEFMRSTDLFVLEESLLDTVLIPGDFLFSREFGRKSEDVYGVVQRTDLQKKLVYIKLLTCASPPKVLDYSLCLSESSIVPHPRYKYFNETNTIAVYNSPSSCIRVGHVQGTNLSGKVSVKWNDTGKDEWCWPAECSVFSLKGYDLECIINLVIGEDEVSQDPKTKLQIIKNRLAEISATWKNARDYGNQYLDQTIVKLKCLISEIVNIEAMIGQKGEFFSPGNMSDEKTQKMTALSAEYFKSNDKTSNDCPELIKLVETCTQQLIAECSNTIAHLNSMASPTPSTSALPVHVDMETVDENLRTDNHANVAPAERMEVDDSAVETDCSSSASVEDHRCPVVEFPDCFRPNVVVEDAHPENHIFVGTQYEQQHVRYFTKVVKDELNNLRDSCPPGIKIKAYGNRFDLFSIMICGPMNTPYENTLYLFDAVLPTSYPSVPPKFHFHSFGAGRLNPNLYAEGKVCVSLLGTWMSPLHQEKWTKESNILQVLLSIQGLILVNEPYHNEPGLEADKQNAADNRARCLAYNTALLPKVALMMINQLKNPLEAWKDEINQFYKENIPLFVARWKKWLQVASSSKTKTLQQFNAGVGDKEVPGFAIWPINAALKSSMNGHLSTLEALHKRICQNSNATSSPTPLPVNEPGLINGMGESSGSLQNPIVESTT